MLTIFTKIKCFQAVCGSRSRKGLGASSICGKHRCDGVCAGKRGCGSRHLVVTVFMDGEVSGTKPTAYSWVSAHPWMIGPSGSSQKCSSIARGLPRGHGVPKQGCHPAPTSLLPTSSHCPMAGCLDKTQAPGHQDNSVVGAIEPARKALKLWGFRRLLPLPVAFGRIIFHNGHYFLYS